MKLKSILPIFIILGLSLHTSAQQVQVKVFVKPAVETDSLVNATLQLFSLPDSSLVQTQVSSPRGNTFTVKTFSKYLLKVTAIGYQAQSRMLSIGDKPLMISFSLKKETAAMQAVVVKSKKPLITQEEDKTIVDATNLANSSTNAYEVLEKTPGAIVDQDGNIYLNSATPATVYINGREMKMSPEDMASLLKSLPAGSISKIEILRTPSAKFDAANSGGIVNVVLKKGVKIGTTGSVNMRYDQGVYGTASAGFNINHSGGKLGSYLSYQFTKRGYFEDIVSNRYINVDTLLAQSSNTQYAPATNYVGAGLDYSFTKKFDLSYDCRITFNRNKSDAISRNDFSKISTNHYLSQSATPIGNRGNSVYWGNSISAKYKIDSVGSEWTNEMNYSYAKYSNTQSYTNNYYLPALPAENGDGHSSNISNVFDIKSDLTLTLPYSFKIETGGKFSYAANDNKAEFFTQQGSQPRVVNNYQTSTFSYTEKIGSAYLQASKKLFGFVLKAGLRLENTNIRGHQKVPSDTVFTINRSDLFPYVYLQHNLFKIFGYPLTANAIYRRSISRPGYDALNPSPKFVDQFLYDVGNASLQPQFTTNYELNVSFEDFPVLALGVNETSNIFSKVTYQNEVTKVAYRTYDNLGKNKEYYFRFFGATPEHGKFFMYAGVQYNYMDYNGIYQNLPLHYKRGSWTLFTGQEYKLSKSMHANLNAWMYIHGFRAFNELKNMGQLNLSITKTFLKNKLSVILSGNDLFYTNKSSFSIQQGTVSGNGNRIQDSRRIGLTLRYNFGVKVKEEKKQQYDQPAENKEN